MPALEDAVRSYLAALESVPTAAAWRSRLADALQLIQKGDIPAAWLLLDSLLGYQGALDDLVIPPGDASTPSGAPEHALNQRMAECAMALRNALPPFPHDRQSSPAT